MTPKLKLAVSQFPISPSIADNMRYIIKQTKQAAKLGAHVIHFPELSLSGYGTNIDELDWDGIDSNIEILENLARELNIHIVVGVHHRNPKERKPFNATYLISNQGRLVGHYMKSNLYAKEAEKFASKDNIFVYDIEGVRCGFLICYDSNFPELFKQYKHQGVEVLFLSYYNANSSKPKNSMDNLMKAQFITRSTDNLIYISGSNSSSHYSRMPSSFVCPDGTITSLQRHVPGILLCDYPKIDLGWTFKPES